MPKVDVATRLRGFEAKFQEYELVDGALMYIPCGKEASMHYFNILFISVFLYFLLLFYIFQTNLWLIGYICILIE